jgi:hypothetical protein
VNEIVFIRSFPGCRQPGLTGSTGNIQLAQRGGVGVLKEAVRTFEGYHFDYLIRVLSVMHFDKKITQRIEFNPGMHIRMSG